MKHSKLYIQTNQGQKQEHKQKQIIVRNRRKTETETKQTNSAICENDAGEWEHGRNRQIKA